MEKPGAVNSGPSKGHSIRRSAVRSTARHLAASTLTLTVNVIFDFMDFSNRYGHVALGDRVNGSLLVGTLSRRVLLRQQQSS